MFEVDLKSQVQPPVNAENPNWKGAACCQMAMKGYPAGATSCNIGQSEIWNYIQANNKEGGTGPWGIGWYADPYAITKTLNDKCPPQHTWVDVSSTDKMQVLYKLLLWMAKYNYASLVCPWAHDYWNLLVYYQTNNDPRLDTNPTLELIGLYDPGVGQCLYRECDGPTWLTSPYLWGDPCDQGVCGQSWNNTWVGIGEPPLKEGSVKVEKITRTGKELIDPKEAVKKAESYLKMRQQEKTAFVQRQFAGLHSASAMLVRELPNPRIERKQEENVHYYIVPFVNKYEGDEFDAPRARFSVLINAYTGRFEEICVFSEPVRYLNEIDVSVIVRKNLRLDRLEAQKVKTELVLGPTQQYVSGALPSWKVNVGTKTLFVTQTGVIVSGLYLNHYRGG
jgi:hypothetical protein